ncbi:MAG: RNA polymerase sigma factor [Bacteroidota bacterium]|nr:RNA polymerase sigma factor [Bacteroidota bacterium]
MLDEKEDLKLEWQQIELAKQDVDAFTPLYSKYIKKIFNYCYHKIGNEDAARDITHEVFLIAIINLKSYKNKGFGLGPWLYKIAYHELCDFFKLKNKEEFWVNNELIWRDVGVILNPEEEILNDQMLEMALKKLNPDELEIIRLRFYEKLPFAEVAEVLAISESNAKVKVHRVIKELRTYITKLI